MMGCGESAGMALVRHFPELSETSGAEPSEQNVPQKYSPYLSHGVPAGNPPRLQVQAERKRA